LNYPNALLDNPSYDPNRLLDFVIDKLNLKYDSALARRLELAPQVLSKLRHRRLPIGPTMIIRIHEETGLSIAEIRHLYGIPETYEAATTTTLHTDTGQVVPELSSRFLMK
jgi:hypothetical protein